MDVFDPRPGNVPRTVSNSRQRVEHGHIRFDTASLGTNATLANAKTFIVPRGGKDQAWLRFTIVDNATGTSEYLWIRDTVFTKSQTYAISDDGYLLVKARHTRNSKGAISSRLRNSKPVTLELPVTTRFEDRSAVTIASTTIVDVDNGTAVAFLASDDTPVVWLNETVDNRTAWSANGEIPITTGRGVFERQTNSSAAKSINRPEQNVMASVISTRGGR